MQELPDEVLARTHPSPIDLVIALAGGLALARWGVAGGATLLFIINAITIAFAEALVFFLRGFAPETHLVAGCFSRHHANPSHPTHLLQRAFFSTGNENQPINEVVTSQVNRIKAELVELIAGHTTNGLDIVITVRTTSPLRYEQVVALQQGIVDGLHQSVSLKVKQDFCRAA